MRAIICTSEDEAPANSSQGGKSKRQSTTYEIGKPEEIRKKREEEGKIGESIAICTARSVACMATYPCGIGSSGLESFHSIASAQGGSEIQLPGSRRTRLDCVRQIATARTQR